MQDLSATEKVLARFSWILIYARLYLQDQRTWLAMVT